jgi:hypothetical protein
MVSLSNHEAVRAHAKTDSRVRGNDAVRVALFFPIRTLNAQPSHR